jgi:hypothetical protein
MEKNKVKISSRGGARAGAGRKPGSKDNVTIKHLLEVLDAKSGGRSYEELLVEDFLKARISDQNLTHKYHHILGNKLFATLQAVEVTNSEDGVAAKALAFQEALAKLAALTDKAK